MKQEMNRHVNQKVRMSGHIASGEGTLMGYLASAPGSLLAGGARAQPSVRSLLQQPRLTSRQSRVDAR